MSWNPFRLPSLKARITVLTLAVFVFGVGLLTIYINVAFRAELEQQLGEQQYSATSYVAAELNSELERKIQALEIVAATIGPATLGDATAMQAFLEQRRVFLDLFNGGVFVTGTDGTAVADVPRSTGRIGTNYMDRMAISVPLTEGRSIIGPPVMGRKLQQPVFGIAAPIRDRQGRVTGVLVGNVNLARPSFLDLIVQHRYGKTGSYILMAPQHNLIITATEKDRSMQPIPPPGLNPLLDRYMKGYEGHGVSRNTRGIEVLSSAKVIPLTGWMLVVSLPTAEAFAPVNTMLQHLFVAASILTLLAGLLIWWVTSSLLKRQISPILLSTETLLAYSENDTPPSGLPTGKPDEIGQLIGGFNRVLHLLKLREEERDRLLLTSQCLSDHLQEALEAERRTLARDIHDQLGSNLTAIRLRLGILARQLPADTDAATHAELKAIAELTGSIQQSTREICTRLRPSILDDLGLIEACRWLLRDWMANTGISASGDIEPLIMRPDSALSIDVFRCLQELLTNVARHAGATHVQVALFERDTALFLRVTDDGHGFAGADKTAGFGLLGVRERASRHHGSLVIESSDIGTVISVTFAGGGGAE